MITSKEYEQALRGASAVLHALNGPILTLKPADEQLLYLALTQPSRHDHDALYRALVRYVEGAKGWHR